MPDEPTIENLCRKFLDAAFSVLREERVIPPSIYHPFLEVGRDYYGQSVMGLPEYGALENLLDATYPNRFADPLKRPDPEFSGTYIFSLLEGSIARCSREDDFGPESSAITDSITELIAVLDSAEYGLTCCRMVTHLTTITGTELSVGEITIVPEPAGFGGINERIGREIPGAPSAWNRDDPRLYDPPHALLILRCRTERKDHYSAAQDLSRQLERFLFLTRLVTAGTVQSRYEVDGLSTLVGRMGPTMRTFSRGSLDKLVRRTARLSGTESTAFENLGTLVDQAEVKRDGMAATSFDIAVAKFNSSFSTGSPYDQLVDLATALEAVLLGGESETDALTLRLRNRASALLSTERDPAHAIFGDTGALYGLRSKLVHGGNIKLSELAKLIGQVSTVQADSTGLRFGVQVGQAVDRMRDLVRRAILARLCLAAQPEPLWPFTLGIAVDRELSDDAVRTRWRTRWQERLSELGIGASGDRTRAAVDVISKDDR